MFAFPAYHTTHCVAPATVQLREKLLAALADLSWPVHGVGPRQITASTSTGGWLGGERIVVKFRADGSIDFTSHCHLRAQCIDFGRNRQNILRLTTMLRSQGVLLAPRRFEAMS